MMATECHGLYLLSTPCFHIPTPIIFIATFECLSLPLSLTHKLEPQLLKYALVEVVKLSQSSDTWVSLSISQEAVNRKATNCT